MPLIYKIEQSNFKLGIWKITEDANFFYKKLGFCTTKKSVLKNTQYMASRLILKELDTDFMFSNCDDWSQEKPSYRENFFYFNVSHSGTTAIAILSKEKEVGVDIEELSERTINIKSKFLNEEELENLNSFSAKKQKDIISLFWTVKEAVLKWIGVSAFDYLNDITIQKYSTNDNGIIKVKLHNYKTILVKVHYFKHQNYWVSYCL
jgi:phosphopantetheine--protein transferase-like protein